LYGAEINIRRHAENYANSYHVAICACCREPWSKEAHSGGFEATNEKSAWKTLFRRAAKFYFNESERLKEQLNQVAAASKEQEEQTTIDTTVKRGNTGLQAVV